jgi:Trk K+ transport system NAD-binding subunit
VIGAMGNLVIAEAAAAGTELVGSTIAECGLKKATGVTLVGFWDHGRLVPATPESVIGEHSIYVLAGTLDQIDRYNDTYSFRSEERKRVVIIGGGRVGSATARGLDELGIDWTIIERSAGRVEFPDRTIIGDGADFDLLVEAGLHEASGVIITTHDDDTNIYLTIFYRRLRKSLQIISRCHLEANVDRLHRAGADLVLSYASMSANAVFNYLRGSDDLLLAEGVSIFSVPTPPSLVGSSLAASQVRSLTGCSIIATEFEGERTINPGPDTVLERGGTLFMIGSLEAEEKFQQSFGGGSHAA